MIGPILGGVLRQRYSGDTVNIVFDGNSLVAGNVLPDPSTQSVPAQLKLLDPLNGVVTVTNLGQGGHTIADMASHGADSRYVAGKRNILIPWEGTNSINGSYPQPSMTGGAAGAAMDAYCKARLAAHPDWIIIPPTTIARFDNYGSSWSVAQLNAELIAYNDYIKANWRAMGCKGFIDMRAEGPFQYVGSDYPSSALRPYLWDNIHYNQAGSALLAGYVAAALKRLPAR